MSDIDHVFARLGGGQSATTEQRELRHIPRRGGAAGSRVVEVVRLPTRGATLGRDQARPGRSRVRAATWDDGFSARPAAPSALPPQPASTRATQTVAHVMPMRQPTRVEPLVEPALPAVPDAAQPPAPAARARRAALVVSRRIADPFDAADDGSNCLRCGYLVEQARERRGLMTCSTCG